jgi:hypothetical protein
MFYYAASVGLLINTMLGQVFISGGVGEKVIFKNYGRT